MLDSPFLAAVRARVAATTPGPWLSDPGDDGVWTMAENCTGGTIAYINFDNQTGAHHPGEDAEFIAHAREDVPQLLSLIDRMGEALENIINGGVDFDSPDDEAAAQRNALRDLLHSLQAEGRKA